VWVLFNEVPGANTTLGTNLSQVAQSGSTRRRLVDYSSADGHAAPRTSHTAQFPARLARGPDPVARLLGEFGGRVWLCRGTSVATNVLGICVRRMNKTLYRPDALTFNIFGDCMFLRGLSPPYIRKTS